MLFAIVLIDRSVSFRPLYFQLSVHVVNLRTTGPPDISSYRTKESTSTYIYVLNQQVASVKLESVDCRKKGGAEENPAQNKNKKTIVAATQKLTVYTF